MRPRQSCPSVAPPWIWLSSFQFANAAAAQCAPPPPNHRHAAGIYVEKIMAAATEVTLN